jgi:uncharacterized protein (TIGR02246 family)
MATAVVAFKPEDCHRLIAEAFTAGDLEAVLSLYEEGATLVPEPGAEPVSGAALKEAQRGLIACKPTMTVKTESVIEAGDIALLRSSWSVTGIAPSGEPLKMSHRGTEVVRRQGDGTWRYVIDNPFGAE